MGQKCLRFHCLRHLSCFQTVETWFKLVPDCELQSTLFLIPDGMTRKFQFSNCIPFGKWPDYYTPWNYYLLLLTVNRWPSSVGHVQSLHCTWTTCRESICRRATVTLRQIFVDLHARQKFAISWGEVQQIVESFPSSLMTKAFDTQSSVLGSHSSSGAVYMHCCWILPRMKQLNRAFMLS